MNKTDLTAELAKETGMTKVAAAEALEALQQIITHSLAKGENVTITGFVTFKAKQRAARTGRNPQTGKPIQIPAARVVTFTAGKTLKEHVKKGKVAKKK